MDFLKSVKSRLSRDSSRDDYPSDTEEWDLEDRILGTLYGNCAGDAIGLLTEFMTKDEAKKNYGKIHELEYDQKISDFHRKRWQTGDWTDDTDQLILILDSIIACEGKVDPVDVAKRLFRWKTRGFAELGDHVGMGIGLNTAKVIGHPEFKTNPYKASEVIWEASDRQSASNGAVMRTAILGVYQYHSLDKVVDNTIAICKVTHSDYRCQASCVAVTAAIALMLQRDQECIKENGNYNIKVLINKSFEIAQRCLPDKDSITLLKRFMFVSSIRDLKLEGPEGIGYTYKTMGAGFWALRQKDFRKALTTIVFEAGDADTNGAVAGAMLGCKLGYKRLPITWVIGLKHKDWFQQKLNRFLELVNCNGTSPGEDNEKPSAKEDQISQRDAESIEGDVVQVSKDDVPKGASNQ